MNRISVITFSVIVVISAVVFGFLFQDAVQQWLVAPFIELLRMVDENEGLMWLVLLVFLLLFAGQKVFILCLQLQPSSFFKRPFARAPASAKGRIGELAQMIAVSKNGSNMDRHLARYLSELLLEVLAYRMRRAPGILKTRLYEGTLEVPDNIKDYLKCALIKPMALVPNRSRRFFRPWASRYSASRHLDSDRLHRMNHAVIIDYIEHQLDLRE